MVSRRTALHLAGVGLVGLAGCTGRNRDGTPADASPSAATDSPTPGSTGTDTPDPVDEGITIDGASATWSRALEEPIRGAPAYADGHVVVAAGATVYGLDADTGETAWTLDAPTEAGDEGERVDATLRVHDGTLYALLGLDFGVGGRDYRFTALDPDGTERWRYESGLTRYHRIAGFGGGAAVLPTHDDAISSDGEEVLAVDLADGEERWRADTGDGWNGDVGEEVAVVEAGSSVLDCFDLTTGERRFRFAPDVDGRISASAVGGGRVFAGLLRYEGDGPTAYALSAEDGAEDWTVDGAAVTSLRYLDDLYVGGEHVVRYEADGTERWRSEAGGLVARVPFDDDALYTNSGSRVVAVDRQDGRELWGTAATDLAVPRARDGDAVVSADGQAGTVFAHGVDDGTERWRATLPEEHPPTPAAGDGGAYLATESGSVVKVPL